MFLGIGTDINGAPALTSNYPYPNLKCTVSLKCDFDNTISTEFFVVS